MELKRPSHDELFKYMMGNKKLAHDFFIAHLPSNIIECVDLDTLKLESSSFIDEELNKHDSDLVFSAKLKDQQNAFFYLVEHQSSDDPLIAFRTLYYIMQLLKRHVIYDKDKALPLPFIYPIILYNGHAPCKNKADIFELFGEFENLARQVFLQPITLIDVGQLSDDEIREHNLAGLLELSLCRSIARDVGREMMLLAEIYAKYHQNINGDLFNAVLKYNLYKWDEAGGKPEDYLAKAKKLLPPELEQKTMTFAESFVAVGEKIGEKKGIDRARQAVELLGKNTSAEEVARVTGLDMDTILFLRSRIIHH